MNRFVFGKKSCGLQRPRVDRFVVPREAVTDERRRRSSRFDCEQTVNIWEAKHQKQRKFRNYLEEVFGVGPPRGVEPRVENEACNQPWPCTPRRKGYLTSADSILDLPTYSYAAFPDLLDWSSSDMLVAALGVNYHMYSWKTQDVHGQGFTIFPILCCKFSPKGDFILIGTHEQVLELHDSLLTKPIAIAHCKCLISRLTNRICAITAIDWSPTGNSFVTGCSLGYIISYDRRTLRIISWQRMTRKAILSVRISPDTRFVAAVILNSPDVHVFIWPSLECYYILKSNCFIKTITWHPWRSALLGLGAVVMNPSPQTTIALWEAAFLKLREDRPGCYNQYTLDAMLFSHRTGELVLSLWNSGGVTATRFNLPGEQATSQPKACSQLVVMSDPYTVVDQSGDDKIGIDRVRTMVFSPDGTKLATATADEDLIIWNFLPEDKKKKNTKPRRFSAMPAYLDQCTEGFVLR